MEHKLIETVRYDTYNIYICNCKVVFGNRERLHRHIMLDGKSTTSKHGFYGYTTGRCEECGRPQSVRYPEGQRCHCND